MDGLQLLTVAGLVVNLIAIVGVAVKLERRITTLEIHLKYALKLKYGKRVGDELMEDVGV